MTGRPSRLPQANVQLIGLLALALIPLVLFGLITFGHLGGAVTANADRETQDALTAVEGVLGQREQDLSGIVEGYSTWDQLAQHVTASDSAWIKSAVLDFVVAQGSADAALLVTDNPISSGDSQVVGALQRFSAGGWNGSPTADVLSESDGVYVYVVSPITGVAARSDGHPVALALAKRLDEHFVTLASKMTQWDVAIAGPGGAITVATRIDPFRALGATSGQASGLRQTEDLAGGWSPILNSAGQPVGRILVATSLGALGSISNQLLVLLAITLAPAVLGALVLSLMLTIRIRRRVAVVESGIAAVADGDYSVRLPEGNRDEFERLASSHNRLASELERRDETLIRLLDSLAQLRPDEGVAGIAKKGAETIVDVFELGSCEVVDAAGVTIASAGSEHPGWSTGSNNGASAGSAGGTGNGSTRIRMERGEGTWELCWGGSNRELGAADEALLELYAGQLGAALNDAELYERAEERARALDRVNKLQADFLRGVSHNLQSPLTAIVGLSDDLRRRDALAPEARERAETIHADAQRLRMLVKQLLTMSRLEAGTLKLEAELCNVEPILRRAWEAHRSGRDFELTNEAAGAIAVADAGALEQVAWILFDNAIRYARTGPVRVGIWYAGGTISIRIEDEGPGVPAGERASIFKRFRRGSTSAGQDGTGLGLDVARGLLRGMNGKIRYEAGRAGASFVIDLPAEVASETA